MRLQVSESKNAASLYIVESTYIRGKRSNRVVKRLGTVEELAKIHDDPFAWGEAEAERMTQEANEQKRLISITYDPSSLINKEEQTLFYSGCLFLQKIFSQMELDKICRKIQKRYKFEYPLDQVLAVLIYGRILFPDSKKATYELAQELLETPKFQLHDFYRALKVLADEMGYIQSELYKRAKKCMVRNDSILYYDLTNFFFEIEQEDAFRRYGMSKENRPNPIVQFGLFLDGDGIPLYFDLFSGNTNEQVTLRPMEQTIIREFGKHKFIICTDAGLSSTANRRFNTIQGRSFITVQSLKKLKQFQKKWALHPEEWRLQGHSGTYNLHDILADDEQVEIYRESIFYKERWFNEGGLEQRFIVTFSLEYKFYLERLRTKDVEKAQKIVTSGKKKTPRKNDPARFVQAMFITPDGELAENGQLFFDEQRVEEERVYDGFYCIATNLEGPAQDIIKVNKRRWEIEESFKILKSEFQSRPVYLTLEEHIRAHFLTCFLALYVFRIFEKRIDEDFTVSEMVQGLRSMKMLEIPKQGFIPAYKRTSFTDKVHEVFGMRTDFEIVQHSDMRKIIKESHQAN